MRFPPSFARTPLVFEHRLLSWYFYPNDWQTALSLSLSGLVYLHFAEVVRSKHWGLLALATIF